MSFLHAAGGSVPGADHLGRFGLLNARNNQDAFLIAGLKGDGFDEGLLALICDGCGGGLDRREKPAGIRHSEVGAWIGCDILSASILHHYRQFAENLYPFPDFPCQPAFWELIRQDVLTGLKATAEGMARGRVSLQRTLQHYFFFTTLGALITPAHTVIFSIGDGLYALNGEVHVIGPFPGNMPPYLTYGLLPTVEFADRAELLKFRLHELLPTDEVESLLLGSDGAADLLQRHSSLIPGSDEPAGPLSQFWTDPRYVRSPVALQRRLCRLNSEASWLDERGELRHDTRLLPDDTTLIVVRRDGHEV